MLLPTPLWSQIRWLDAESELPDFDGERPDPEQGWPDPKQGDTESDSGLPDFDDEQLRRWPPWMGSPSHLPRRISVRFPFRFLFFIPFTKAARETVSVKTLINHDIRSEAVAKPSRLMVFARLHKDFCSSAPREAT